MNNLIQTIQVLTPEEVEFVNAELDKKGKFIDDFVSCRHLNEFTMSTPEKIDYIEKIELTGKTSEQYGLKNKIIVIGQGQLSSDCVNELTRLANQGIPIIADVISNGHNLTSVIQHHDLFLDNKFLQDNLKPDLLLTFGKSIISKNLKLPSEA